MKICHYNANQAGIVVGDKIYNLGDALVKAKHVREGYTMLEVIDALANNAAAMAVARDVAAGSGPSVPLASAKLLAPITNPGSFWAAASNYKAHQAEMIARVGTYARTDMTPDDLMAEFFLKPTSAITGPGGPVVLPRVGKHVDFECELCAVIGNRGRKRTEANAHDIIFGYTMAWDISVRDPWGIGKHNTRNIRKGFDTFAGIGPWIVTKDEIPDPQDLHIRVTQNGKEVMVAHTADMICNLRQHIRFLTDVVTLRPGDLITTGTPAGVSRLAPGDKLHGSISKIGEMDLDVVADKD